jgi:hypothetical protein
LIINRSEKWGKNIQAEVYNGARTVHKRKKSICIIYNSLFLFLIVSMTQAGDRESYRRAFAAATVHDMFNWLSVIVLTILELSTGFLEISSEYMVNHMIDESNTNSTEAMKKIGKGSPDFLKPLTKPLTNLVVQVDKKVLLGWSFQVCIFV